MTRGIPNGIFAMPKVKSEVEIIKFIPRYDERIWGGRALKEKFDRILPIGVRIGESRELYDMRDGSSAVDGGEFEGMTLRDLLRHNSAEIMGCDWDASKPFPVIVKILDCQQILSLQVHPDKLSAERFGGKEKNEAWYFINCALKAHYYAGLKTKTPKSEIISKLSNADFDNIVASHDSHAGDFCFIRAGIVHALGAGNMVLEIQENSPSTYRIFDWDRVDLKGNKRELHLKEALESINATLSDQPAPLRENGEPSRTLLEHPSFKITRVRLEKGGTVSFCSGQKPRILSLIRGCISSGSTRLKALQTVLIPYAANATFTAQTPATFLLTEDFCK